MRTLRRTPRPRSGHSRLRSFFHGPQSYRFFVDIQQLPVFSLWKNTDTLGQGYVTGLEPGTSFAYNRSYQRALNRVPTIAAKEKRQFDITYTLLVDKAAVDKALQQVQSIQHERPTEVRKTP